MTSIENNSPKSIFHRENLKGMVGLACFIGFVGLGTYFNGIESDKGDKIREAQTQQISNQLKNDGFKKYSLDHAFLGDRNINFSSLVLGNCVFQDVSAEAVVENNTIKEVKDYSVSVSTLESGTKFAHESITLNFDNSKELEESLPHLNCTP